MAYDNIKSHKETGLHTLSLENTFLEKPQRGGEGRCAGGGQIHPLDFLGLSYGPEKFLQDERLSIKGYAAHSRYLDYRYLEQMPLSSPFHI